MWRGEGLGQHLPNHPQVIGRSSAAPGTPSELSYEVLVVLIEAVRAGSVFTFPLGTIVITVIGVVSGGFVSPISVLYTDGNVLVVHVGVVKVHVVEALLGGPEPGPQLPCWALLLRLVPRYAGIHKATQHSPAATTRSPLHRCPLVSGTAGIKHDINQWVSVTITNLTHTHKTVLTLNSAPPSTL